jgi:hypothetical protein
MRGDHRLDLLFDIHVQFRLDLIAVIWGRHRVNSISHGLVITIKIATCKWRKQT